MKNEENYFRTVEYEIHIEEAIRHNQNLYRYPGQSGQEYGVIQSIFQELNRSVQPNNKHIRWYTSIISLADHYHLNHIKDPILPTFNPPVNKPPIYHQMRIPDLSSPSVFIPLCIETLGSYLIEISRLGILVSGKIEIVNNYLHRKMDIIIEQLMKLLSELKLMDLSSPHLDMYLLSVKNGTENCKKINRCLSGAARNEITRTADSQLYREVIVRRTEKIPAGRLRELSNMDDFWNGLLP